MTKKGILIAIAVGLALYAAYFGYQLYTVHVFFDELFSPENWTVVESAGSGGLY